MVCLLEVITLRVTDVSATQLLLWSIPPPTQMAPLLPTQGTYQEAWKLNQISGKGESKRDQGSHLSLFQGNIPTSLLFYRLLPGGSRRRGSRRFDLRREC